MKSTLKVRGEIKVKEYPCLKILPRVKVVLFTAPHEGIVVNVIARGADRLGYYSDLWVESSFLPYTDEVVLSNDD